MWTDFKNFNKNIFFFKAYHYFININSFFLFNKNTNVKYKSSFNTLQGSAALKTFQKRIKQD